LRQTYFSRTGKELKRSISEDKFTLTVRVTPNSSTNVVSAGPDGKLMVRLTSPPVDGKANKELIKLIAKKLKIPQSAISIERGEHSRDKMLLIRGISRKISEQDLLD